MESFLGVKVDDFVGVEVFWGMKVASLDDILLILWRKGLIIIAESVNIKKREGSFFYENY